MQCRGSRPILFALLTFLALALPALAAKITWDTGGFETKPSNSDLVSEADDRIRELKEQTRLRGKGPICWSTNNANGCAAADNGRAREGSARGFFTADCSADITTLYGFDANGSQTLDNGRICFETGNNDRPHVWNGSWSPVQTFHSIPVSDNGTANDQFDDSAWTKLSDLTAAVTVPAEGNWSIHALAHTLYRPDSVSANPVNSVVRLVYDSGSGDVQVDARLQSTDTSSPYIAPVSLFAILDATGTNGLTYTFTIEGRCSTPAGAASDGQFDFNTPNAATAGAVTGYSTYSGITVWMEPLL